MISRPKARNNFLFLVCKLQTWLKLYLQFIPDHFWINFLAHRSLAPQCERRSRGGRRGSKGEIYRGGGERRRGWGGIEGQGRMLHLSSRRVFGGIYHNLRKSLCHRESLQRKKHLRRRVSTRKNPLQKGHQLRRLISPKCLQRNMVQLKLHLPVRGRLYLKRLQVNH